MLSNVAQGFLRHTIQFVLNFFGELVRPPADVKCAMNSAVTRKTLGELAERMGQIRAFERLWPQSEEHPARVFQTAFGRRAQDAPRTAAKVARRRESVPCARPARPTFFS